MATSSKITPTPASTPRTPEGLRLRLSDEGSPDRVDGAWWPRSRDLQREAADLVDNFPAGAGRISRMLFSRPDWDDSSRDGRGVRSILAARGAVKVGSFPSDDTHLMILTMSSARRLRLLVIPSDTPQAEAEERLSAAARPRTDHDTTASDQRVDVARWDDEHPAG
jgi:hypothetical protein